jgi:hypothetical protein
MANVQINNTEDSMLLCIRGMYKIVQLFILHVLLIQLLDLDNQLLTLILMLDWESFESFSTLILIDRCFA